MSRRIQVIDRGDGRLYVTWWAGEEWPAVLDDFKATFPTHADRGFSWRALMWTVPLRHAGRLCEWAARWFSPDAVQWDEHHD